MFDFGKNLRDYRKRKKISQVELADAINVKQGTIANYENGNRTPTIEVLVKIAQFLDLSTDKLLGVSNTSQKSLYNIDFQSEVDTITELLVSKNDYEVFTRIKKIFKSCNNLVIIFEQILTSVMYKIGDFWEDGEISIADEHYAAEVIRKIISWLSLMMMDEYKKKYKAVCMAPSSEMHTIGIQMASVILEQNDYESFYIGNNLPTNELIKILLSEKPDLFILSITIEKHFDAAINLLNVVKNTKGLEKMKLALGGQGVKTKEYNQFKGVKYIKNLVLLQKWLIEINSVNTSQNKEINNGNNK